MNKKVVCISILIVSMFFLLVIRNMCFNFFSDVGFFISAMFRRPKIIGAILPSSSFVAESIASHIKYPGVKGELAKSRKILEVGAGTGVFTQKIVEKMTSKDLLDVIEIDESLCDILQEKFKNNKNVHVYCLSVLDWNPDYKYDFIISGLPFNSFSYIFVDSILEKYKKIAKSGGIISYFEYVFASVIRKFYSLFFSSKKDKIDFAKNIEVRENFRKALEFDCDFVFLNIPPAHVYHMRV